MTTASPAARESTTDGARVVDTLELRPRVRASILEHAASAHPEEACGILVGSMRAGIVRVSHALCCTNEAPLNERMRRFAIDPRAVLNVQRELRSTSHAIIGFYHSHPEGPAAPSPTDLEFIRLWPDSAWLIAGRDAARQVSLRAWWLDAHAGDAVRELCITIPAHVHVTRCPD
jgi:desampylase